MDTFFNQVNDQNCNLELHALLQNAVPALLFTIDIVIPWKISEVATIPFHQKSQVSALYD